MAHKQLRGQKKVGEKNIYSRRPLFRTRKGPEILFELANVRINRS